LRVPEIVVFKNYATRKARLDKGSWSTMAELGCPVSRADMAQLNGGKSGGMKLWAATVSLGTARFRVFEEHYGFCRCWLYAARR
jgi:hypothetical protein